MKFGKKPQASEDAKRQRPVSATQPGVFSYYSQRSGAPAANPERTGRARVDEPTSQRKRRPKLRIGYLPSYVALVIIVGALIYSFWLQPVPRIAVSSQPGTIYQSGDVYQAKISQLWRKSLLNQTKLTVQSTSIQKDILNEFGEIADATIELPLLGRRPTVKLTPAKPAMQLVTGTGTYYVSIDGRVMASVDSVQKNQVDVLPLVRDEIGLDVQIGKQIIPQQQAQFIQQLYAQLLAAGQKVQTITLPSSAANEADVRLVDGTYYIKFSTTVDARQAVGSYLAAKDKLTADGTLPAQYIDVRVEEKVFYQ